MFNNNITVLYCFDLIINRQSIFIILVHYVSNHHLSSTENWPVAFSLHFQFRSATIFRSAFLRSATVFSSATIFMSYLASVSIRALNIFFLQIFVEKAGEISSCNIKFVHVCIGSSHNRVRVCCFKLFHSGWFDRRDRMGNR